MGGGYSGGTEEEGLEYGRVSELVSDGEWVEFNRLSVCAPSRPLFLLPYFILFSHPFINHYTYYLYRYSQLNFTLRCMFPTWRDWDITYTRRGLAISRVKTLTKSLATIAVLLWVYRLTTNGQSARAVLRGIARGVLQRGGGFLLRLGGRV